LRRTVRLADSHSTPPPHEEHAGKDRVGALVGAFDGELLGALVGELVGVLVGAFDGALVGALVGAQSRHGSLPSILRHCLPIVLQHTYPDPQRPAHEVMVEVSRPAHVVL